MQSRLAAVFHHYWAVLPGRRLQVILTVLAIGVAQVPSAGADYLSDLEAEADASASVPDADTAGSVSARGGAIGSPKSVSNERMQFERALKVGRPNVYTFYSRLSEAQKTQVVEAYTKGSGKISKASNLILDLYFQKK